MKKIEVLYLKYIVKSLVIYLMFILIGVSIVLILAATTKVSVIETFDGTFANNRLVVNEVFDGSIKKVYVYKNRSDTVVSYDVLDASIVDDSYTVLYIIESEKSVELEGVIKIDVERGHTSLLNILIGIEKRYVEKERR